MPANFGYEKMKKNYIPIHKVRGKFKMTSRDGASYATTTSNRKADYGNIDV